jgi:chitinase
MNVNASQKKMFSLGLTGFMALAFALVTPPAAKAHGSVENPPSRTYMCRFLEIDDPMCEQAWSAEPQALYDWMEVNLGDVAGRHREQIPDGKLCAAGRDKYAAFDVPGNWPATVMVPGSHGLYELQFYATAPHAAQYFRLYLSREGFDPLTQRLGWQDLELVFDSGEVPYADLVADPHYPFRIALPEREGRAILYFVWQRSDSPEAFYGCSDVVLEAAPYETSDPGSEVVSEPLPEEEPSAAADPVAPAPGLEGLSVDVQLVDEWGSGACGEGLVTNHADQSSAWEVHIDLPGTVTTFWDSEIQLSTHPHSEGSAISQNWRVVGAAWNRTLAAGASTSFGFCLDRTLVPGADEIIAAPAVPLEEPPAMPADDPVLPDSGDVATEPVPTDVGADDTDPVLPSSSGGFDPGPVADAGSEGPILAAYYPEWGIYSRDYRIADVPGDELTHLIYAFADLGTSGDVTLFDPWAAVEVLFRADQSVSGVADAASSGAGDPRGNFDQIAQLKERYPHLRVFVAVGGWTLSAHFSSVLSTEAGRQHASDSLVSFLTQYDMFDGVDFDWEYPGGGGLGGNTASSNDGEHYALFVALVRDKLDTLGEARGKRYGISIASPAGSDKIANFNLAGLAPLVDFFNVMTYDFHGTWEDVTGHLAALQGDPGGYDVATTVSLYRDAGVPPEKMLLGFPLYTRAWSGVADGGDGGYAEAASGAAPGSFWDQSGMYDYKDLLGRWQAEGNPWELYWDDNSQAAYLYNGAEKIFSSFETPGTVAHKSQWAQSQGLAGMMFWDLSSDQTGGDESLISAAVDSWVRGLSFDQIVAGSDLAFDRILGGNGRFDPVGESPAEPAVPGDSDSVEEASTEAPADAAEPAQEDTSGEAEEAPVAEAGEPVNPEPPANEQPPYGVSVAVDGQLWWNGFTANLTIRNGSPAALNGWSFRFRSSHTVSGSPWGVEIQSTDLGDGFYEHRVSGSGWTENIPSGGSVSAGFNGTQGASLGNAGSLSAAQLFDAGLLPE